jgi:hypothetical protein
MARAPRAALSLAFALLPAIALAACGGGGGTPGTDAIGGGGTDATDLPGTDTGPLPGTDASTASCGTCPTGYTCGTINGAPICRSAAGIPLLSHVFIIAMENTTLSTLEGTTNTPYLHGLIDTWASSSNFHGVVHPSLGNYLALTSGQTGSVDCDCEPVGSACNPLTCNIILSSCGCPQSVPNLADQIEAAGLNWRMYGEDMGAPCNTASGGMYETKHIPFLYYDLRDDVPRCTDHVVDYSAFAGDVGAARAFSFITPNMVNDMHDPDPPGAQNYANGDTWLAGMVPSILASSAFTDGGLLVIWWDEDDLSGLLAPDDPIPMIFISPLAKNGGYVSTMAANHYSLLATIQDGLALPRLAASTAATPLSDLFPDN